MALDVARLGIRPRSRQTWKALFSKSEVARIRVAALTADLQRVKKGLAHVTDGHAPQRAVTRCFARESRRKDRVAWLTGVAGIAAVNQL